MVDGNETIAPTFDGFVLTTRCILFAVLLAVRLLHRLFYYKHGYFFLFSFSTMFLIL